MQVKEIEALIKGINVKLENLRCQKNDLQRQLNVAKIIEFEAKHGIKAGDKLTTKHGEVVYYDHIAFFCGLFLVLCHPIKKNGTASKKVCPFGEDDFIY